MSTLNSIHVNQIMALDLTVHEPACFERSIWLPFYVLCRYVCILAACSNIATLIFGQVISTYWMCFPRLEICAMCHSPTLSSTHFYFFCWNKWLIFLSNTHKGVWLARLASGSSLKTIFIVQQKHPRMCVSVYACVEVGGGYCLKGGKSSNFCINAKESLIQLHLICVSLLEIVVCVLTHNFKYTHSVVTNTGNRHG